MVAHTAFRCERPPHLRLAAQNPLLTKEGRREAPGWSLTLKLGVRATTPYLDSSGQEDTRPRAPFNGGSRFRFARVAMLRLN